VVTHQLHTYCAMCVSRCGVLATIQDAVLTRVTPDPDHPNGGICAKGAVAPEIPGRGNRHWARMPGSVFEKGQVLMPSRVQAD
jgi:anaerobic selenocysteine-containing dehydrogenase